ncbi:hypothetical protein GCM10017557_70540 [Streptomyces aurantiacus]|uniref:Uncharacterized protein n=1 Tax=Streptomyces aurantiacus TaxID=47760 RepID=A0A7G1PG61_9ACTN|nr:hypothetical protein GCM10017557_70540 [Streptomyces aurantiacus]
MQRAQFAASDGVAGGHEPGVEAPVVADLDLDTAVTHGVEDVDALLHGAGDGLLIATLDRIARRGSQGVTLKAPDVPEVTAAVGRLVGAGIPVVTLVTDLPASGWARARGTS